MYDFGILEIRIRKKKSLSFIPSLITYGCFFFALFLFPIFFPFFFGEIVNLKMSTYNEFIVIISNQSLVFEIFKIFDGELFDDFWIAYHQTWFTKTKYAIQSESNDVTVLK